MNKKNYTRDLLKFVNDVTDGEADNAHQERPRADKAHKRWRVVRNATIHIKHINGTANMVNQNQTNHTNSMKHSTNQVSQQHDAAQDEKKFTSSVYSAWDEEAEAEAAIMALLAKGLAPRYLGCLHLMMCLECRAHL